MKNSICHFDPEQVRDRNDISEFFRNLKKNKKLLNYFLQMPTDVGIIYKQVEGFMKKAIISIFLFFLLILVISCSSSYSVKSQYDKFEDISVLSMEGNKLGKKSIVASLAKSALNTLGSKTLDIYFNAQKIINKKAESYRLQIIYKGEIELGVWLKKESESLVLLVDGNRMGFKMIGEPIGVDIDNSDYKNLRIIYSETLYYPITLEQLKIIANAKTIEFKLAGQSQYYQTVFDNDNFENLKQFINDYAK
jgi:hypothetical protein